MYFPKFRKSRKVKVRLPTHRELKAAFSKFFKERGLTTEPTLRFRRVSGNLRKGFGEKI